MKKPIIITLFLLLSTLILRAQDSIPSHHAQPDSVIKIVPFDVGSHTSYLYTIGGKIQTPEHVQIRILAYAPSAYEYHQAKNGYYLVLCISSRFRYIECNSYNRVCAQ